MPSTNTDQKRGSNNRRVATAAGLSMATFKAADDAGKVKMLTDINQKVKIDDNQNDNVVQKFLNALGWANNKPTLVADEDALIAAARTDRLAGTKNMYHTDAPTSVTPDAADYAAQYHGQGRHYASDGIAGAGTYWATDSLDSLGYGFGARSCYQIKGFLNKKAKVIDMNGATWKKIHADFLRKNPSTYNYLLNHHGTRSNYKSIIAAMYGYNVIKNRDYYTILDRSATTVTKKGYHGASFGGHSGGRGSGRMPWKHN